MSLLFGGLVGSARGARGRGLAGTTGADSAKTSPSYAAGDSAAALRGAADR